MSNNYNGFNDNRTNAHGVGGKKPHEEEKMDIDTPGEEGTAYLQPPSVSDAVEQEELWGDLKNELYNMIYNRFGSNKMVERIKQLYNITRKPTKP